MKSTECRTFGCEVPPFKAFSRELESAAPFQQTTPSSPFDAKDSYLLSSLSLPLTLPSYWGTSLKQAS